ncbi:MAG: DUF11 domain-containing protein, partial [bacterium]|nr:DUF11 domain-containing protein [bacterium]
ADLVLSQSDSADPVRPGDEFTWTVTVTNQGPDDAEQVVVTDSLPEGVALVATSGCAEDPAGTPDCTLGTIPAGESRFYELTVSVEPGVAGTLLHSASVTSAMAEAQPGDEESTEATEVVGEADLAVELNGPATAVPGGEVRYTLTVSNLGPDEAVGVQVLDYFVPELVGVSWSRSKRWQGQTGGWQGQTTRTVKRRTDVLSNVSGVGRQEVCPCLPGQKQGQAGEAWQGQTTRTVKRKTDVLSNVSGVRRQEVCPCLPGQKQGQGVLVTTGGGMPAHQRRPDELPQVLALATLGQASGILDDVVDLAAGDAVTYDITATVAAEATDTVGHSAFVESGGVADPNPVNDAATTAAELHPAADLLLALENGRAELIPGKTIAYTAIVSNPGPSDAPPVRLTGTFPLTDATVICTDCEKTSDATELDETFAVPAGGSVVWVVAGTVPDDVEGTLVSEVALELPPDFDDPDPSNNQAMDVDEVIPGEVGTLGPPRRLAEGRNPAVVFSDSGRSLVVFEQGEAGGTSMIRGLDIDASGVPGNDFPLSIDIGLNPAVDLDADLDPDASKQGRGAYLTVWQEEFEPSAVLGQLSRDGRPLGPAMGLSTRPTSQVRPDIVRRPAGGFLVVWESTGADAEEEGIFGRFVDPAGRPVDDVELRINRETERTPQRPVLATDGSRFLVVWDRPAGDDERRIAGQRVTPAGDLAGPTLELSDMAGAQTDPDVAFDQDSGRYMVAWRQQEGDGGGIAGRVFDPAGRPQGEPFLIGSEGDRNPEVSSEEGNFTVVWERALGPRSVTFGQLIDPEGRPVGNEFRVSGSGKGYKDEETGGAQPAVAYAPHGAIAEAGGADVFAVIWGDRTADDAEELNGQRYAVTADLLLTVFDDPDPLPPGASA